jgi:hypothetical protein
MPSQDVDPVTFEKGLFCPLAFIGQLMSSYSHSREQSNPECMSFSRIVAVEEKSRVLSLFALAVVQLRLVRASQRIVFLIWNC